MVKIYIFELKTPFTKKGFSLTSIKQRAHNLDLSLIGKVLTKKIVSEEMSISETDVVIGKSKLGKPLIKIPLNSKLDISISHSGNYLAIGVCDEDKVGIDIEQIKNIDFKSYKNYFSADEEIYVNSGKINKEKLINFYELWTIKEACLKMLGIGLCKPLPITQFYPKYTKPQTLITYNNQTYHTSTIKEEKFVLSICTTKPQKYSHLFTRLTTDVL